MSRARRLLPALVMAAALPLARAAARGFTVDPPADPFLDVDEHHWAFEAIEWLREQGLLEGWGERFHGRRSFTRYEMAEILARYSQKLLEARDRIAEAGDPAPPPAAPPPSTSGLSLRERIEAARRQRTEAARSRSRRRPAASPGGGEAAAADHRLLETLDQRLSRVAALVATHQALLEDARGQDSWRRKLARRTGPARGGGLRPEASLELAGAPQDPRRQALLSELDRVIRPELEAPPAPAPAMVPDPGPGPSREDESRRRLRAALGRLDRLDDLEQGELRSQRRGDFTRLMRVSRGLRTAGEATPAPSAPVSPRVSPSPPPSRRPPPALRPTPGAAGASDRRLFAALQDVRSGRLEPDRARVVARLATLAAQARQSY